MIDFTGKDELSIIALADERAKELIPEWKARHTDDLNWATILTVARLLSISNFYIDLAYNEMFPTAQLRKSLLRQAKQRNMPVKSRSGAIVTLRLERDDVSQGILLPRGTSFGSRKGNFYLLEDVVIEASQNTKEIIAVFGTYKSIELGQSNGQPFQTFILGDTNIQKDTLKLYVDGVEWEEEFDAIPMRGQDNVYKVWKEPDERLRIDFGDGFFGNIPASGKIISVSYLTLDNDLGRVVEGAVNSCSDNRISRVVQVGNSIGGEFDESIESLQKNLEQWGAVQNRIVTPKDAVYMAKRYPGVLDAKIIVNGSQYFLYIVTEGGYPSSVFLNNITNFLNKRKIDLIDIVAQAIIERELVINIDLEVDKKYRQDIVIQNVKQKLLEKINKSTNAGKNVYIFDIYGYLNELKDNGITRANIIFLYKKGLEATLKDVILAGNEMAVLQESDIIISATGGL